MTEDIPYHVHNGVDSALIDKEANGLTTSGSFWTLHESFEWNTENLAKSFTSLPLHDVWLLTFDVYGGVVNDGMLIRINSIAGTSYYHTVLTIFSALGINSGGNCIHVTVNGGDDNVIAGDLYITGKSHNSVSNGNYITFRGEMMSQVGAEQIFGAGEVGNLAGTDVNRIDILTSVTSNWVGKGQLFYRDLT